MPRFAQIIAIIVLSIGPPGCRENSLLDRSLIFSTHTAAGIEVSVNPVEVTGAPARLMIGYSRTEGVINPVYDSRGVEAPAGDGPGIIKRYREPEAYSVLAKFAGSAGADAAGGAAQGGAGVSQFFATGNAALILARQPGIAGAVSGSPEIARASVDGNTKRPDDASLGVLSTAIKYALDDLAAQGDPVAAVHLKELNELGTLVPPVWDEWTLDAGKPVSAARSPAADGPPGFETFNLYTQSLSRSIRVLSRSAGSAADPQLRRLRAALADIFGPGTRSTTALGAALGHIQTAANPREVTP